jgi:hypothetical protein
MPADDTVLNHVSYTEPRWRADPLALLDAARRWRSPASITLARFDIDSFSAAHGLHDRVFDRPEHVDGSAVLAIMNDPAFRVGPESFPWDPRGRILDSIDAAIRGGRPVEVLLPSFAGRPHNPAAHRRVAPDLGELYALQLLKNISIAVSQVHRPGVLFTLVLDGRAYRPFYGYSDDEAMPYSSHLQRQIDLIGARGRLQIVDMHDLMTARRGELDEIDEKVRREVATMWDDQAFGHRKDLVRALRQGTETTAISAAFIELTKSGDIEGVDVEALLREAVKIVGERAEHTAFEYAVLLTKLRELDVLGAAFPQAVRGTVHPKPGQYSPRIKNPATRISPWHGVAIRTPSGEILTEYESRIYQEFESYEGVFIAGDEAPFFYRSIGH